MHVTEALRQLGKMLEVTPPRTAAHYTGGGSKGSKREPLPYAPPTLAEMGLDKKTSHVAKHPRPHGEYTISNVGNGSEYLLPPPAWGIP